MSFVSRGPAPSGIPARGPGRTGGRSPVRSSADQPMRTPVIGRQRERPPGGVAR
ncbi:hypothetical protein ATKI12_5257 [Kitasatospora sp. Ki12]